MTDLNSLGLGKNMLGCSHDNSSQNVSPLSSDTQLYLMGLALPDPSYKLVNWPAGSPETQGISREANPVTVSTQKSNNENGPSLLFFDLSSFNERILLNHSGKSSKNAST